MTPWMIDGNDLWKNMNERFEDLVPYIVQIQNQEVRNFLNNSLVSDKTILVGEKGTGKSLLLSTRSFLLRSSIQKNKKVYCFFPDDLTERLQGGSELRFAIEKNPAFWRDPNHWRDVWTLAILAAALEATNLVEDLSQVDLKSFRKFFDPMYSRKNETRGHKQFTLMNYLNQVVLNWSDDASRNELFRVQNQIICPAIHGFSEPICFFVDSPDEALDAYGQTESHADFTPWVSLQLGLLYGVRALSELKSNFYVFAALRSEIYNAARRAVPPQPLFQQAAAKCLILKYHTSELRSIFAFNCIHDEENWITNEHEDPIANFLGAASVAHPRVKNDQATPVNETSFDTLMRHTLFRPRDLMVFGQAIRAIPLKERTETAIRKTINTTTNTLLDFYKSQVTPLWNERCLDAIHYFHSNIISRIKADQIKAELKKHPGHTNFCALQYLCSHGMLGTVDTSQNTQFFVTDPEFRGDLNAALPISDWYFLHPILDQHIEANRGNDYKKSKDLVVGYSYSAAMPFALKIWKKNGSKINIEFHDQVLFQKTLSLTKPVLMFLVFALAVKNTGNDMLTRADLVSAISLLAEYGWIKNENTALQIIAQLFESAKKSTDNSSPVNKAFTKLGATAPIAKVKGSEQFQWKTCSANEIDFRLQ